MAFNFEPFEKRIKEIEERAGKELSLIRTGRASPAILDAVWVESYGTRVSLVHIATVNVEDVRTIRITPFDMGNLKEIEKAISVANLGLSVGSDEKGIRVSFPELTSERRANLLKLAKEKVEELRTELRVARDRVWNDIQRQEKEKTLTEDEKFRSKDEMQKRVDAANRQFDQRLERKEKEISG